MSGSHETLFCWLLFCSFIFTQLCLISYLHVKYYKFYITFYSHFITDLELQLGTAPPPCSDTSIATWSGLL